MDIKPGENSTEVRNSFVLFGRMSVAYEGRASSTLESGYYLLVRKPDGSTMVHGADLTVPLNYQSSGSKMYQHGWSLTVCSKKEQMKIDIHEVLNLYRPDEWSNHKIVIVRTEKQLRDWLADNLDQYISDLVEVRKEMPTEHGPIDLIGIDAAGTYHVFELKRHRISVAAAVQLRKYMDAMERAGHKVLGYVVAPSIIPGAQIYCDRQGYRYIRIEHREPSS